VSNHCELSSYTELAEVLASLPMLLRETRRARRLSLRAAATEIGCSFSTIARFEAGDGVHSDFLVAAVRWLAAARTPEVPE
jgi:transcriptional regulator with XRE-family HTH domain